MQVYNKQVVCVVVLAVLALCCAMSLSAAQGATDHKTRRQPPASATAEEVAARAQAAMEAERIPEAIRLYYRATALRPKWTEGWWRLGTLLFDSERFREARDAFARFVTIEQKQPGPGFAMLGLSEFHLKHYPNALAAMERGKRLGFGSDTTFGHSVLYHLGMVHTVLGEYEIALERLTLLANQIAAAHPEAPKDAVLADVDLQDALGTAALRIPKLASDIAAPQAPLVRQAGRIQALIALQDRGAAETEFKQLLALYPSEPGLHYMYGAFLLEEHPSRAIDEFRSEIEISPSHDAARIQLAFEYLRTADFERGLKYAKEAVALEPRNFAAHVVCGRLLLALEKTDLALAELRTAVKLAPGSPDAHFALYRTLSQTGHASEAAHERAEFERLKALSEAANQYRGLR